MCGLSFHPFLTPAGSSGGLRVCARGLRRPGSYVMIGFLGIGPLYWNVPGPSGGAHVWFFKTAARGASALHQALRPSVLSPAQCAWPPCPRHTPQLPSAGVPVTQKAHPLRGTLSGCLKPSYLPRLPLGSRLEKAMHSCPYKVEIQLEQLPVPLPPTSSAAKTRTQGQLQLIAGASQVRASRLMRIPRS